MAKATNTVRAEKKTAFTVNRQSCGGACLPGPFQ
jgi:hypothetical protein